ncbi:Uncharacterised protein [Vibrio cholerae]|uniref:Uncharacterized protein n=1 Tax=Vibrio cholerae TaxID=666 RepID=A0A655PLY2_VIBCL|nr:Uncharacterised protein [Vibrio cholerae]CSA43331.1 Uncharacterised protein [Vibrio cholerae]CSA71683.1 Uncharacterised protein [Vibrio cholerae]CSB38569.1 Uncharacterised protein [Vibrio cholerae]CSB44010.1 Uncharacterised protein [Vibrio cholerae]
MGFRLFKIEDAFFISTLLEVSITQTVFYLRDK